MTSYGDLETFLYDIDEKVIRFWVHKRMFTPYEMAEKFSDESLFENPVANFGYIRTCVNLGSGEYLLGIEPLFDPEDSQQDDSKKEHDLWYFLLSEIRFQILEYDQLVTEE